MCEQCVQCTHILGDEWSVNPEVIDLEQFACAMYGHAKETPVIAVRTIMLKQMIRDDETLHFKSRIDLSRLPTCKDSLVPHIYHVNHRIAHYKRASNAIFKSPKPFVLCQGWEKTEDNSFKPIWSCGPILPSALIDVIAKTIQEVEKDEHQEEGENDYDDYYSDEE